MKLFKLIAASLAVLAFANSPAWAGHRHDGHRHWHSRVFIGVGPYWDPWYYQPRVIYAPPQIIYREPPVYIEQGDDQSGASTDYWYYCAKPKGYYPYVKQCPDGWQQVAPTPPDAR